MFNYNNLKYKYLTDMIELSKSKYYDYANNISPKNMMSEFNTICIGGVRQSGKTTSMKKVFNANKDIYISPRLGISDEFLYDSYKLNLETPVFEWSKQSLKNIKERNAVLSMGVSHLKERLLITLKEDSIIFLDVFSVEIPDNYKHVVKILEILHELSDENKIDISKIMIVYT